MSFKTQRRSFYSHLLRGKTLMAQRCQNTEFISTTCECLEYLLWCLFCHTSASCDPKETANWGWYYDIQLHHRFLPSTWILQLGTICLFFWSNESIKIQTKMWFTAALLRIQWLGCSPLCSRMSCNAPNPIFRATRKTFGVRFKLVPQRNADLNEKERSNERWTQISAVDFWSRYESYKKQGEDSWTW